MWIDRRRLAFALAGSLLLNVFLGGVVAGHLLWARPGLRVPPAGPLVPAAHVRALPADEKKTFTAAMAAHRDAIHAARKAHRQLRETAVADIAAATFDRAKVSADLAALRGANTAALEATNAALVDALAGLSPASRAALVARDVPPEEAGHP